MRTLAFILIVIPFSSLGQYFGVPDSLAKKYSIKKCTEYNKVDSLSFFQKRPNGYYWHYDRNGNNIESNFYSYLDGDFWEHIHYRFYDENKREYLSLWSDSSYQHKIYRARISQFDSTGKPSVYIDLTRSYNRSFSQVDTVSINNQNDVTIDTVFNSKNNYIYHLNNSSGDTLFYQINYYTQNRRDSIVTFLNESKNTSQIIQRYLYNHQGNLLFDELEYINLDGQTTEICRTKYNSERLPVERWYRFIFSEDVTHTGFSYQFYE